LAEYRDALAHIAALDAGVVALSVDAADRSEALRRSLRLPYPLLGDSGRRVIEEWSLFNRAEMGGIAYPAVFVIDRDLTVRYRSLDRTASRVSTDDVVAFLAERPDATARPAARPRRRIVRPRLAEFALALRNMLRYGMKSPRT
jgi:peroxiredoxin